MINLIDKYKGEFLRGGLVYSPDTLNPISFAQDPTYLSFHVEFFYADDIPSPDTAASAHSYYVTDDFLVHEFSHNGLFQPPKYNIGAGTGAQASANTSTNSPNLVSKPNVGDYNFTDSAEDYLYAIGAVNKLASLRSFKRMLYSLQKDTPWYFQKITGGESLYTLDPKINTKKDGVLTFECLESIDQRVSLLADLYRLSAWDFERHREVLPYNLRTFKMRIHVFEMRNFNTYSGTIANFIKNTGSVAYESQLKAYWELTDAQRQDILNPITNQGLGGNSRARGAGGNQNGGNPTAYVDLTSAFNAISVRTYELSHCEFDFYSTAPNYLSELTVGEVPMANFTFKIKYGTVRNISDYPFYRFVLDSVIADSKWPTESGVFPNTVSPGNIKTLNSFYEPGGTTQLSPYDNTAIPPGAVNQEANFNAANNGKFQAEKNIREQFPPNFRLGGIGGRVLGALESRLNTAVQGVVSRVNSALLGNVFDRIPSPAEVAGVLRGFLAGDRTIDSGGLPTTVDPDNIGLEPLTTDQSIVDSPIVNLPVDSAITQSGLDSLSVDNTITGSGLDPLSTDSNVIQDSFVNLPVDSSITEDSFTPLSTDTQISQSGFDSLSADSGISNSEMTPPPVQPKISPKNIFGRG
jgi:hypothetical protein